MAIAFSMEVNKVALPFFLKYGIAIVWILIAIIKRHDPPAVFDSNKSEILLSTENKLKEIYEAFPNEGKVYCVIRRVKIL